MYCQHFEQFMLCGHAMPNHCCRQSCWPGGRVVGSVEGSGVRQALPEHNLDTIACHPTAKARRHPSHAGELVRA